MKQTLFTFIFLLFICEKIGFTQTNNDLSKLTLEENFSPKMPTKIDTSYYPFYNGVQMIEIDHIGYWDRKIYFLEQSTPRAMPHSMYNPMPIGNEFFFRDTTGVIVKAFNTEKSLDELTKLFKKIPINKKHGLPSFSPYHSSPRTGGSWYQSPQSSFDFLGHYKVSSGSITQNSKEVSISSLDNKAKGLKFGLIDSLGNIVIPIQYNTILPLYENLLVQKEKWGVIDYNQTELVPLQFDSYEVDHYARSVYPPKNGNVFFLTTKKLQGYKTEFTYNAVFFTAQNQLKTLNNYDKIYLEGGWGQNEDYSKRILSVTKSGKKGLLNAQYEEIVSPQFEIFEYHKNIQRLYRVAKDGEFGFWDQNFKQIIPLEYDYAEHFGKDSTALVLKDGTFSCINTQGEKQTECNLTPKWKMGKLGFVIDKKYVTVFANNDVFGVMDNTTMEMILPIKYKSLIPISVNEFINKNENTFKENKFKINNRSEMYDEMLYYDNKIIVKNENNQYGVIDTNFRIVVDFKYDTLEVVYNLKYLIYSLNGKLGLVDFSGKEILTTEYDDMRYSKHYEQERDIFQVQKNGKWGIVNFENKTLVPCEYDSIKFLGHWNRPLVKLWVVEKNNKFGVVNDKNEIFIPFEYDGISHLEGNNLWVEDKNRKRYKVEL
ncbi:MAG: WG repeat-containing protein [Crocinitomicaceae bacterium]|nr:WG repeat-containing protein [Crocinitomicaceae bacterium]